jgi:alpha-N-arabinofuranosidase
MEETDILNAKITIERELSSGTVERNMFGSFIEHLGRAVYTGIYEPGHADADAQGFRNDVASLVRELGIPLVRYPGGNFVSNYRWEDGTGAQESRPVRLDLAWRTLESNKIGVNEFVSWCKKVNTSPMLVVNLGTRGLSDALALLEYCNHGSGSYYSDLRVSHGCAKPHGVKYWCLGNEMDGDWQVGHKTASEYGRLAAETAKAMRMYDPDIKLVSCGSSSSKMRTFPEWEAETLRHTYDYVDYISLHQYFAKNDGDSADYLASPLETDRFIKTVVAACDYVKAVKRGKKDIMLSFDEWNVWYHSLARDDGEMKNNPWRTAPRLLEDVYTFEDALVVGGTLITFMKNANRLKMACLAQLVNVIAPIMTEPGGGACRQTIFYPFAQASAYGGGTAILPIISSPKYDTKSFTDVPSLDAVAVYDDEGGALTLFAINRDVSSPVKIDCRIGTFEDCALKSHIALHSEDLGAVNTVAAPNTVLPKEMDGAVAQLADGRYEIILGSASWNVIRFQYGKKSVGEKPVGTMT